MDLKSQKTIASRILKCGKSRVWLDPSRSADISEAITAADVKRLVNDGVIKALPKTGVSTYRKKKLAEQKRKGRRKGIGSRKGRSKARAPKKRLWAKRIRAIRQLLRDLKKDAYIDNRSYRTMYMKAKSGFFRNKAHIMIYLERNDMLLKKTEKEKFIPKKEKKRKPMKKETPKPKAGKPVEKKGEKAPTQTNTKEKK